MLSIVFKSQPKRACGIVVSFGASVQANGIDSAGPYRAARDMLLRRPPRVNIPGMAHLYLSAKPYREPHNDWRFP